MKYTVGLSYEIERFIQAKDKRQKTKDRLHQNDKSQAQKNRNMCGNLFKLVRSERFELPTP